MEGGLRMDEITETQMHNLICAFCDNKHCCKGTDKCEFEQWKEAKEKSNDK